MELAHTRDNGLSCLLIGVGPEGGVFLCQLGKADAHLFLARFGLGLNGHPNNRLRELHGFQNDWVLLIAQGVAGSGVFQAHSSRDITRVAGVNILAVVGMHLEDTTDSFVVILGGIVNGSTGLGNAGIYTEEAQLAYIRVSGDLKRQGCQRLLVRRRSLFLLLSIGVNAFNMGNINRGRHIVNHCIQELLDALIAVGSTADNGNHLIINGGLANNPLDILNGDFLAFQVFLHNRFVLIGNMLQQFVVIFLGQLLHILRDFLYPHVLAQIVIVDVCGHIHQVDNPLEGVFRTNGKLDRHRITFKAIPHHGHNVVKISAHNIHLVDIRHSGNPILVSLTPNCLRLGFHAAFGTENGYGTVQNTQGTFHLNGEVHVSGCINDIDAMALPERGSCSRGDGDAPLLLLLHPVHCRRAIMSLTYLMRFTCVKQNTFGGGGFSGVNVGHNADITGIL